MKENYGNLEKLELLERDMKNTFTTEQLIDKTLKNEDAISGAFNWCLLGLKEYLEKKQLPYSQNVIEETCKYANNGDSTNKFIKDCLQYTGKNTSLNAVFESFLIFTSIHSLISSNLVFKYLFILSFIIG